MSYFNRYDKGDWKAICDICGGEFKASELRQRWDGFMVDSRCWEPRHPQDFVRGVADTQAPKWTRPEATDTFSSFACSTRTSLARYAIAGCMIAGNYIDPGTVPPPTFTP